MTEYPEWLVDELAAVIGDAVVENFGTVSATGADEAALAVLKHLDFTRREGWGHVPPGSEILHYGWPGEPAKHHERWVGGTKWKEVN